MHTNRPRPRQRGGQHGNAGTADAIRDAGTITVHVPLAFRRRRGRKVLVAPEGYARPPSAPTRSAQSASADVTPAVRAIARAFRWRKLIETGAHATVNDLAEAEGINPS